MTTPPADPATTAAVDRSKRFRDASDKVRERSDATAKGLAALGTTGLTAVGITKFADLYPLPPGEEPLAWLAIISFVLMSAMLAAFIFRLWNANKPLVPRTDLEAMMTTRKEIDEHEKEEMKRVYDETALRHGAANLQAFEARGDRLQRIADRTSNATLAGTLKAMAERIRAETEVAFSRAQLIVVRRRMNSALKGPWAVIFAIVFVASLVGFGLSTDHIDSERTTRVAAYKACAEAITAKVDKAKLPDICAGVSPSSAASPTAEQTAAAVVTGLTAAYGTCIDTAVEHKRSIDMCDGIKTELASAVQSAP
jgi:hypothetical protein